MCYTEKQHSQIYMYIVNNGNQTDQSVLKSDKDCQGNQATFFVQFL